MQTVSLTATLRFEAGKGAARRMRRSGSVPGIFYGPKIQATPVTFMAKQFRERVGRHESSSLIEFDSEADALRGKIVLLKDAQYDALSGEVTHADFLEVDMSQRIRVHIALHFVGKPAGVVRGGILQPIRREIEVECLPARIPESIDVDVSNLDIGDSIHVSQLTLPDGVAPQFDVDFTLVTVASPTTEAAPTASAAEEAAAEEATADTAATTEEDES